MYTGSNVRPLYDIGHKIVTKKRMCEGKDMYFAYHRELHNMCKCTYISTWILYVKGISLAPWQHMMSRLFPATLCIQGYFRQHQGSKPFKDLKQKQTEKWLWIEIFISYTIPWEMFTFWKLQGCKCCCVYLDKNVLIRIGRKV